MLSQKYVKGQKTWDEIGCKLRHFLLDNVGKFGKKLHGHRCGFFCCKSVDPLEEIEGLRSVRLNGKNCEDRYLTTHITPRPFEQQHF